MIQVPAIDLDMYGTPSKCDFYKEDWQRMFLKLPLNQKNPEVKELTIDFLMKLDAMLSTTKFKEAFLGVKKNEIHLPTYLSHPRRRRREPEHRQAPLH